MRSAKDGALYPSTNRVPNSLKYVIVSGLRLPPDLKAKAGP